MMSDYKDDLITTINKIKKENFPNLTDDIINQIVLINGDNLLFFC